MADVVPARFNNDGTIKGGNYPVSTIVGSNEVPVSGELNTFTMANFAGNQDTPLSQYYAKHNTYAGTDIVATILVPNEKTDLVLGELQTISYSIHRENSPVRVLGSVNPAGFVRGPRTIAGSLIFTQFDEYTFYRLAQYKEITKHTLYPLADMLPPFDIIITFANEYGRTSKMKIFGVTIIDEGGTMSIDDMVSEQTYTYMARGIQPLTMNTPTVASGPAEDAGGVRRVSNVISFRS
jgi:hypothetical protein